ncbi:hypothetical protein [Halobacterium salinarum]|uniref:Uncharacterized protein n=3 Tax=Halobacterium salinarum TaxID=2242 RepID=Q9HQD3_HALSA|nr:hypothetical protein [Halobacterium salinarum]AAG19582.1 hypothetical protein VNG_1214H [Halobacterium salinarum NRC-1]MBB6090271.1 hypothetical protein [Halobacterium salinarum]MDL0119008.1 hypothetical protein [Halobacterium salinarum]MDL0131998.1 hypothetical protein [Halobacterium salinarum]MDL0133410.1 hypothetical protein [Halobacterium salinarum]
MTSHTDYRLAEIEDGPLERLAIDLLTRTDRYQGVDPQGGRGKDGGKDGLLLDGPDGTNIIVHVSRREDWKQKLKTDLGKAADHDRDYDIFVYVTNRIITGNQKPVPDVAQPFVDEYGWEIDIWDGERLRSELDNNHQDLRERYLRIARDEDPTGKTARLIDERLRLLRRRDNELPRPVRDAPTAVLHLVPHDAVSGDTDFRHDDLPTPSLPGRYGGYSYENTLDGRVTYAPGGDNEPDFGYIYVDTEGWVEAVDAFMGNEENMTIGGQSFEKLIGDAYEYGRNALNELELDGPFEVGLSVLSVKGYSFATKKGGGFDRNGPKVFRQNDIEAKPHTVEDTDSPTGEAMKRGFDRVWRGARWSDGSPYYSDNEWHFER